MRERGECSCPPSQLVISAPLLSGPLRWAVPRPTPFILPELQTQPAGTRGSWQLLCSISNIQLFSTPPCPPPKTHPFADLSRLSGAGSCLPAFARTPESSPSSCPLPGRCLQGVRGAAARHILTSTSPSPLPHSDRPACAAASVASLPLPLAFPHSPVSSAVARRPFPKCEWGRSSSGLTSFVAPCRLRLSVRGRQPLRAEVRPGHR